MNKQIIFVGDSLTEWGNWDELFPNYNTLNFGVAGEKTADILTRIEYLFKYNPSKIFIMMGINDLGENITLYEVAENYNKVIAKLSNNWKETQIFILSTLPVDVRRWTNIGLNKDNIKMLNTNISSIAQKHNITYIDMVYAFSDKNGYLKPSLTSDGLHLNPKGYEVWKKQIEPYIEN
jgi:lysophospholipase L1-like esterase